MPIIRHSKISPKIIEPEINVELAKYMDMTKFLSLLKDQQLFFCRVDKLEDRFEGTMPTISKKLFIDYYKYLQASNFFTTEMTDEKIEKKSEEDHWLREKLRALNCINCWNEFHNESYALWKIYSDLNQGIMIKSSYKRIINAFEESNEEIYCSRVNYIDYDKDSLDIGNTMSPFVHKNRAYSYENEIRLIHEVSNVGWEHDWEKEKYVNGIKVKVNLHELINEIIISPFSPDWFIDLIQDIINKYSFKCDVLSSKLK